jgi:hypothetical protein
LPFREWLLCGYQTKDRQKKKNPQGGAKRLRIFSSPAMGRYDAVTAGWFDAAGFGIATNGAGGDRLGSY